MSDSLTIFRPEGYPPDEGAVNQILNCLSHPQAVLGALMADHHLGYSMPIGGVIAYDGAVSPTGVGFDIACGNMAVKTTLNRADFDQWTLKHFISEIQKKISFGIGRVNNDPIDHELFDSPVWLWLEAVSPGLKQKAAQQLGTVGSGNHYVDLLIEKDGTVWIANHFGSRGLGHTIASGFMALAADQNFTDRVPESEDAVVFDTSTEIGSHYLACMELAGQYAYAGREYVSEQVLGIIGAQEVYRVHNHHNYSWHENGYEVVRKGATPLNSELAFIGGSMGTPSVIVRGQDQFGEHLGSAPHGAGRLLSRTKAAGKMRKMWYCNNRNCSFTPVRSTGNDSPFPGGRCPICDLPLRKGRMRDTSDALIDWKSEHARLADEGIVVAGAGADEAPGAYKDIFAVLGAHTDYLTIETELYPIGVVMAGDETHDPYKD